MESYIPENRQVCGLATARTVLGLSDSEMSRDVAAMVRYKIMGPDQALRYYTEGWLVTKDGMRLILGECGLFTDVDKAMKTLEKAGIFAEIAAPLSHYMTMRSFASWLNVSRARVHSLVVDERLSPVRVPANRYGKVGGSCRFLFLVGPPGTPCPGAEFIFERRGGSEDYLNTLWGAGVERAPE